MGQDGVLPGWVSCCQLGEEAWGSRCCCGVGRVQGDAAAGQPCCVASPRWGWGEEQLQLTKGRGGTRTSVLVACGAIAASDSNSMVRVKEKKHKGKAKEEQLEAGRKKRKSYTARWHPMNAWAGDIGWEVIVLIMVKTGSFLSVGL